MPGPNKPSSAYSPPGDGRERLRARLEESDFDVDRFESAVSELEQEFEDADAYWLGGALESVSEQLWRLLDPAERPGFADASASRILDHLHRQFGLGEDARGALEALEQTKSSFWYDDLDIDELESARDEAVDALNALANDLRGLGAI